MTTLADIAKICGLSAATISNVINGNAVKMSPATRDRVLQVVREMNYQPSAHARSLSRRRANMIGLLIPHQVDIIGHSFFSTLTSAIHDTAREMGQTLALYNGHIWKDEENRITVFSDGRCDGLIVIDATSTSELNEVLRAGHMPYVIMDSGEHPVGINSIDIDNTEAGRMMTRYLIDLGHRRIAFLHADERRYFSQSRMAGYRKALNEAGIPFDDRLVLSGKDDGNFGAVRAREIAAQPELGITALFCATDHLALSAMRALIHCGLRVPTDISVVGIDDVPEASHSHPQLTTVSQSLRSMGEQATRLLMSVIDNPDQPARNLIHPCELIVRDSSAVCIDRPVAVLR